VRNHLNGTKSVISIFAYSEISYKSEILKLLSPGLPTTEAATHTKNLVLKYYIDKVFDCLFSKGLRLKFIRC